jgi:hypothetical protein
MRRPLALVLRVAVAVAILQAAPPLAAQYQQQGGKLVGTGALGPAGQGCSVALSSDGSTAAVGACGDNANGKPWGDGATWVWTRSGSTWTQQAKIAAPALSGTLAEQGWAVAISSDGNTLLVGSDAEDLGMGAARVWTRSGSTWTVQAKLQGTDCADPCLQGTSVALSADGNTAIIGGPDDAGGGLGHPGVGAAWVFTRSGSSWTQQGPKLVGSGAAGFSGQGFSIALSGDGNTAAVGGPFDSLPKGAAWIWTRSGGVWTQQGAKLSAVSATPTTVIAAVGTSAALSSDGNTVVLGGYGSFGYIGAGIVFARSGGTWSQVATLVGLDYSGDSQQGQSVALSADGRTAVVGGYLDNVGQGAAWVFLNGEDGWRPQGPKIVGSGGSGASGRGWSVAISADAKTVAVGGVDDHSDDGAVWIDAATAPAILLPPGNSGGCEGNPVSFAVTSASWLPQTFQWQVSTDGGSHFNDLTGENGDVLNLTAATALDGNLYRVVATNSLGSATSDAGQLTVATAPAVTTQPANQTVTAGQTATFTAAASGVPSPTVAWFYSRTEGLSWIPIPSATSPTLSFTASGGQNGTLYRAEFSTFCATAPTAAATLTVNSPTAPPTVTTQPSSIEICPGGSLPVLSEFLQQGARLQADDASGSPALGESVALSADGNTLLVGGVNDNGGNGAAWVFTRAGGLWTQQGPKLVGSGTAGAVAGASVALASDGNIGIVGGWGGNLAWIWTRTNGVWTQQGPALTPIGGVPNEEFGYSVSISADGNTAAVGGNYDDHTIGAAWVFVRNAGVWTLQGSKLVGTGASGDATQGNAVALSGDGNTLAVGGVYDDTNTGAVWIFTRSGGIWTQQGEKLVGTGAADDARQGWKLALSGDGNTLLDGTFSDSAPGGAFIFTRTNGMWVQQGPKLVGAGAVGNAAQGAVALSADGNVAAVGGYGDDSDQGALWIFTRVNGAWMQQGQKLVGSRVFGPPFVFPPAQQGTAVALSADGTTVADGGPFDVNGGSTWIFARNQMALTASADGSPVPSTQWQVSTDGGATFQDIPGATNFGLNVTASPSASGDQYRAVFTNGSGTATSQAATLEIDAPPFVTSDPVDQTAASGDGVSFTAAASGDPAPTVQWQVSALGRGPYMNVPGATSSTLAFTATADNLGNRYRAVFTNGCGTATTVGALLAPLAPVSALPMAVDAHTVAGDSSNHNGVLEAGETVSVAPAWQNNLASLLAFNATASGLTGPAGPTYTLNDGSANYGSVAAGSPADCFSATGDCYLMTVSGPRPAAHWDAAFDETLGGDNGTHHWLLHVGGSFPDVPVSQQFYKFIENLFHNGITGGCGGGDYCPNNSTTRGQMAVFLLKSKHGLLWAPPPCTGIFPDVVCPSQFADWIEELLHEGITGGCGGGDYCPNNPVRRDQMAVFLLKAQHGAAYVPAACTGEFADVPCPSQFANWIEALAAEQITGGCGGGDYCPSSPNTRGQMAVFLVKSFGLLLYGP